MISLMGDGQQRRSGSRSMNGNRIEGEPKSGGAAGRLLITGAGGFCGSHAVRHFASAGYEVHAVVRPGSFPERALGALFWDTAVSSIYPLQYGDAGTAEIAVHPCHIGDRTAMMNLVSRISPDAVLHLAGANAAGPSWRDPAAFMETNLMGTVYLLEAVRAAGSCTRILVAGSMLGCSLQPDAPPQPPHPYSLSKTMQIAAALSWHSLYGMDIIVADPSNLIGPGPSAGLGTLLARYAAACEKAHALGEPMPPVFKLSSATEERDFLDVRDAMRAYELLLARGVSGGRYAMASGVMRPLGELAGVYERLAAVPLNIEIGTSTAASPEPADVSVLRSLGWGPLIPLEQSAADTLAAARLTTGTPL